MNDEQTTHNCSNYISFYNVSLWMHFLNSTCPVILCAFCSSYLTYGSSFQMVSTKKTPDTSHKILPTRQIVHAVFVRGPSSSKPDT